MRNPLLASRYAKSLFDLANETQTTSKVLEDVKLMQQAIQSSGELSALLRSPILKADKKMAVLKAIFGSSWTELTEKFILLLVQKGRESNLEEITASFIDQYQQANKIKTVKLVSAAPMGDEVKDILTRRLQNVMPGYEFNMSTSVNPDLIGGFTLEMDDKLVDASIRRDLQDVKMQFQDNLYVKNIR